VLRVAPSVVKGGWEVYLPRFHATSTYGKLIGSLTIHPDGPTTAYLYRIECACCQAGISLRKPRRVSGEAKSVAARQRDRVAGEIHEERRART